MRYVFSLLKQRQGDTVLPQLKEPKVFRLRHNAVDLAIFAISKPLHGSLKSYDHIKDIGCDLRQCFPFSFGG